MNSNDPRKMLKVVLSQSTLSTDTDSTDDTDDPDQMDPAYRKMKATEELAQMKEKRLLKRERDRLAKEEAVRRQAEDATALALEKDRRNSSARKHRRRLTSFDQRVRESEAIKSILQRITDQDVDEGGETCMLAAIFT